MSISTLVYWCPVFLAVAFGARPGTRARGATWGVGGALLWVALVEASSPGWLWQDGEMLASTLCGAAAIALLGWAQSRVPGPESRVPSPESKVSGPKARLHLLDSGLGTRDSGPGTRDSSACGRGFAWPAIISVYQQFDAWLEVHRYHHDPWADFDEFLRSLLFQWVGGTRVRTYRVLSEGDQLIPLREIVARDPSEVLSARRGVEGYVATTGRSFMVGDVTHGTLVEQLRTPTHRGEGSQVPSPESRVPSQESRVPSQESESGPLDSGLGTRDSGLSPAWCFAIVRGTRKIGVVAVGSFETGRPEGSADGPTATTCPWTPPQLRLVELVLAQFWNMLTEACRSRMATTTDPGSSGLTRQAFFEIGREVLADAYRQGEPVAVAVIGMEGLRALDDEGQWAMTDEIRAGVSQVLKERLREDDRLGRFDDSRFVLLLRRVDSELATLIIKELMNRLAGVLRSRRPYDRRVELRCGLSGSGVTGDGPDSTKPSLEHLVGSALEACLQARQAAVTMWSDLQPVGSAESRVLSPESRVLSPESRVLSAES